MVLPPAPDTAPHLAFGVVIKHQIVCLDLRHDDLPPVFPPLPEKHLECANPIVAGLHRNFYALAATVCHRKQFDQMAHLAEATLLGMPAEIRHMIYQQIFASTTIAPTVPPGFVELRDLAPTPSSNKQDQPRGILFVNKALRSESMPVFLSSLTVELPLTFASLHPPSTTARFYDHGYGLYVSRISGNRFSVLRKWARDVVLPEPLRWSRYRSYTCKDVRSIKLGSMYNMEALRFTLMLGVELMTSLGFSTDVLEQQENARQIEILFLKGEIPLFGLQGRLIAVYVDPEGF